MSEQEEDLNAFNSWDCFGATLMLGITPAVIHLATTREFVDSDFVYDIAGTIIYAIVGVVVSLIVLAVALITRWKMLGKIINWLGMALTICYISYVVNFWMTTCSDLSSIRSPQPASQTTKAATEGS